MSKIIKMFYWWRKGNNLTHCHSKTTENLYSAVVQNSFLKHNGKFVFLGSLLYYLAKMACTFLDIQRASCLFLNMKSPELVFFWEVQLFWQVTGTHTWTCTHAQMEASAVAAGVMSPQDSGVARGDAWPLVSCSHILTKNFSWSTQFTVLMEHQNKTP